MEGGDAPRGRRATRGRAGVSRTSRGRGDARRRIPELTAPEHEPHARQADRGPLRVYHRRSQAPPERSREERGPPRHLATAARRGGPAGGASGPLSRRTPPRDRQATDARRPPDGAPPQRHGHQAARSALPRAVLLADPSHRPRDERHPAMRAVARGRPGLQAPHRGSLDRSLTGTRPRRHRAGNPQDVPRHYLGSTPYGHRRSAAGAGSGESAAREDARARAGDSNLVRTSRSSP